MLHRIICRSKFQLLEARDRHEPKNDRVALNAVYVGRTNPVVTVINEFPKVLLALAFANGSKQVQRFPSS